MSSETGWGTRKPNLLPEAVETTEPGGPSRAGPVVVVEEACGPRAACPACAALPPNLQAKAHALCHPAPAPTPAGPGELPVKPRRCAEVEACEAARRHPCEEGSVVADGCSLAKFDSSQGQSRTSPVVLECEDCGCTRHGGSAPDGRVMCADCHGWRRFVQPSDGSLGSVGSERALLLAMARNLAERAQLYRDRVNATDLGTIADELRRFATAYLVDDPLAIGEGEEVRHG